MEIVFPALPVGAVLPFAGTVCPDGFLFCHGQYFNKTAYPKLFEVIGNAHGGDANGFNLPDYRGTFLRGVDGVAGKDPDKAARTAMNAGGNTGNNVGSFQGHAFQTHTHIQNPHAHNLYGRPAQGAGSNSMGTGQSSLADVTYSSANQVATNIATGAQTAGSLTVGTHAQQSAAETRPVNANVNFIIKV